MALAARIVTRVGDGMSLKHACDRAMEELAAHKGSAAVIAIDAQGNMCQAASEPWLSYAMHGGKLTLF